MIRFHALGALTVTDDGGELNLGGPRLRRLAAMLLIHRNTVVSVDRLADAVFAGEPTGAASTTLRSYVARIRRVLGGDSGAVLVTQSPGYSLRLPVEAFDVACFEDLVAAAGSRTEAPVAPRAAATLREALGLWRGEAYAEFADEDWARPEANRLAELRLVALERLVGAELACGRAAEVIPEIHTLTVEHPLREAFRAQLMTALYRTGRQAEALQVFRDYRELLVSELGVEPSPALVRLERRVLNHEQELMLPEPAGLPLRGYRLGQRLGVGRDGTVYAASLPGVDRDFAVRIISDDIADSPDFERSFEAFAQRVASVRHPALVPVHDYWREPGAAYLVMRRLDGGSLADRLARGRVTTAEAAAVVRRVGGALVALAEAGIAHGRLTPDSVLFDKAGNAYLGDLPLLTGGPAGLAEDVHDLAQMLTECLSPGPGPVSDVLARGLATVGRPSMAAFVSSFLAVTTGEDPASGQVLPNPYKGLLAFDEADAGHFFGREELVEEVLERLRYETVRGRLVLVVGGSGTGKSSVVRAGVLPRLRRGDVAGSERWFVTTMLPGASPFKELAESLRRVSVVDLAGLTDRLAADAGAIDRVLRELLPGDGQLLLVVDQLEELFTLATEEDQRAFLGGVMQAVSAHDSRLRVVATLRADFYDRPLALQPLADLVNDATVTMVPMSPADLEAAIVGPVEAVGGTIERSLVAELVGAVGDEPAALPSLQFTLYELAERSPTKRLELAAYRELGGLAGAIASRAERLYGTLDAEERVAVRRMFERLVVLGVEGEPTRRRAARTELSRRGADTTIDTELDRWAQARLLTFDRNPQTRMPTVELAHEALLHRWPRLEGWIDEDRETIATLGRLREATTTWLDLERDPGALYRGARLALVLDLVESHGLELADPEREFLEASTQVRDREAEEAAERVARQGRDNRRLRRQRAAVVVALVVALVGGFVAFDQRGQARQERQVATARELAAAAAAALAEDPERALLLALEAVRESRAGGRPALPEAVEALHRAMSASRVVLNVPGVGGAVDWSPDGSVFVTEGPEDSGIVDLRDATTGESVRAWRGHDDDLNDIVFSSDGTMLVTAGDDGTLRVWETSSGDSVMVARTNNTRHGPSPVRGPSISLDGTRIAAAWPDAVRVYDVVTGRVVAEIPVDDPTGTSLSPDGRQVAFASFSGAGVVVTDVETGKRAVRLGTRGSNMIDVEWSPDGRWIAAGGDDAMVGVWDPATGGLKHSITGHLSNVWDVEWSPDSRWLASAGNEGVALVSDVTGQGARTLFSLSAQDASRGGGTQGVAFGPDGMRLMTGDSAIAWTKMWDLSPLGGGEWPSALGPADLTDDGTGLLVHRGQGTLDVVDIENGDVRRSVRLSLAGGGQDVWWIDANDDGSRVAVIDGFVGLVVFDTETGDQRFVAARHHHDIGGFGWSADGNRFAVAVAGGPHAGKIRIFDRDGIERASFVQEPANITTSVSLSPDGRTLAATRRGIGKVVPDVPATIWDSASDGTTGIGESADRTVFDGSGTRIATSRIVEGTADIWDIATGDRLAEMNSASYITALAFSADGTSLATGHTDGKIRLWDAATGVPQMELQDGHAAIESVAFTPDGAKLVSTNADSVTRVWALDVDDLVALAERRLTRELSNAECRQYLHLEACPDA